MRTRKPESQEEKSPAVTRHKIGGPLITHPTHGMSGWEHGELYIYDDGMWGLGKCWLKLGEFQRAKEKGSGHKDYRLHSYQPKPEPVLKKLISEGSIHTFIIPKKPWETAIGRHYEPVGSGRGY